MNGPIDMPIRLDAILPAGWPLCCSNARQSTSVLLRYHRIITFPGKLIAVIFGCVLNRCIRIDQGCVLVIATRSSELRYALSEHARAFPTPPSKIHTSIHPPHTTLLTLSPPKLTPNNIRLHRLDLIPISRMPLAHMHILHPPQLQQRRHAINKPHRRPRWQQRSPLHPHRHPCHPRTGRQKRHRDGVLAARAREVDAAE